MIMTSENELYYWLALSDVNGIGRVLYKRLIDAFASPEAVFSAAPLKLKDVEGINDKIIRELKDFRPDDKKIRNELIKIKDSDIRFITLSNDSYPQIRRRVVYGFKILRIGII